MAESAAGEALFTYGTLRYPEVQRDTFGRLLDGADDVLPGYRMDYIRATDARIAEVLDAPVQPTVRYTGNARDKVVGRVVWLTENELEAADEYEVTRYRRVSARLASGLEAWVYVSA